MNQHKLFGTDGIRGIANQSPITSEIALAVGRALISIIRARSQVPKPKIVVGKDTRISGPMLEYAIASGLCSMGADAILVGFLPTPGIALLTQALGAEAGVMISASHNPYADNGIKIFSRDGFKFSDTIEDDLSLQVLTQTHNNERPVGDEIGRIFHLSDSTDRYLEAVWNIPEASMNLKDFRIIIDCAHGAAFKVAPRLFEKLNAEVILHGVHPDGVNINQACGAIYPQTAAHLTKKHSGNLGISLDGDADRCILADENGEVVDGDQIIGLCAIDMAQTGKLKNNAVVVTPMSNIGLDLSLAKHGISVWKAPVGDRNVVEKMRSENCNLGGEQSGHIIFLDHATTGDGLLAALKVIEIMKRTGKPLSELKKQIQLFPQIRVDVRVSRKDPFERHQEISEAILAAQSALKDRGRVFVRYSGTEPLARIMLEGESLEQIQGLSQNIATHIQHFLS